MKRIVIVLLIIFMWSQAAYAVTKRALVIAIGNYPSEGGWPAISSLTDTGYINPMLRKQGFLPQNITVVTDEKADIKGLNAAFTKFVQQCEPGDIALIHFSCHGEQVEDDNGDETDGLDECIVAYDAIAPNKDGFTDQLQKDGAGYFRDDALGNYVNLLRSKLGKNGDVIVFMDNCHSGTGTRGIAKTRGGKPPMVSRKFDPKKFKSDIDGIEKSTSRGDASALATYIVFSAARAEELNNETEDDVTKVGMGSLTYAITKSFESLDKNISYRSLFAKVQTIMNEKVPSQHPVLEGTGIDRLLFGGDYVNQKPYIDIDNIVNNRQLRIKAGLLAGLDIGAKVAVYKSDVIDPQGETSLAKGIVVDAQNYASTVQLESELTLQQPAAGRVFVTSPVYHINPINLQIMTGKNGYTQDNYNKIKDGLKDMPLVRFEGEPELVLVKGVKDSLKKASNGYLFTTIDNVVGNSNVLQEKIEQYARYKFLQTLAVKESGIGIDVKFIPVVNGKAANNMNNLLVARGGYEVSDKDTVVLYVKNNGTKAVYINILDLSPDGEIAAILPNTKAANPITPSELKIEPGQEHIFNDYHIYFFPPYGTELYKIFASTKEINMEDLATSNTSTRGNLSGLESLVKKSNGLRGSGITNTSNADGSTFDFVFTIKPAK